MSDEAERERWRAACPDITERELQTLLALPGPERYGTNAAWLLAAYRAGFDDGRHTAAREVRPARKRNGRGHRR